MDDAWTQHGKVRAREAEGVLELVVDGLTTQAKYYKPLIYEFFRKAWRGARPAPGSLATRESLLSPSPPWGGDGGEFAVEIRMEYVGDPPWLDLDNLAKAILDAIKGYAFHDDAQVARLLVERASGERERITVTVRRLSGAGRSPLLRAGEVR
ncbi:MAG TPA: RusA family crossover junction endodeoxyribonuclease [Phenylobacterium sp.]|uniref:RusA family crossover junction endodeoxyribonuclease n=1 Tax=Phenylobacterium sp. TaxID=1871053 RepID=UPI002B927307|nr:RusA family crossover junction endodeoxyribonuclease [Phenylobacterium sp.]HXA40073.1 RusA family crossover junction endodeoxyribonuclease [Phenylobacterium sp.]